MIKSSYQWFSHENINTTEIPYAVNGYDSGVLRITKSTIRVVYTAAVQGEQPAVLAVWYSSYGACIAAQAPSALPPPLEHRLLQISWFPPAPKVDFLMLLSCCILNSEGPVCVHTGPGRIGS